MSENRLIHISKRKSLTARTWYVLGGALLFFGLVFILSILIITQRSRWDYEIKESETVLNAMSGNIQANVSNYKDISRLVMLNTDVVNFLKADKVNAGLLNDTRFGVLDILNVCSGVDSLIIFRNDEQFMNTGRGEYVVDDRLMENVTWQQAILDKKGGAIVFMNGNNAIFRKNGNPLISICRAIYDINSQERIGILLLNISTNMLDHVINDQKNTETCILSTDGTLLAGSESLALHYSEEFTSNEIVHKNVEENSSNRMISGCVLQDLPLVIMCATTAETSSVPMETTFVMLLLLVAFIVSISITAVFVTRNITRPVNELSKAMEQTKESGWLKKIDVNMPENEIGGLSESYNSMIEYLNDLFTKLLEKEKSVQKAEMRVLHEQIKPHFLYNSLESISFMALDAGAAKVHSALETLGSFYRNFLSKGDREIPLKREISIIKDYLSLQKLRYGDIINDEYDISEETLECKIPKLILQPLVENSIYHGIRLTGEPGTIKISSKILEDTLIISVRDTGVGMSQDIIDNILDPKKTSFDEENGLSGFGLKGTIDRIRYYCDKEDVIKIQSEPGEYTEITISIPLGINEREK